MELKLVNSPLYISTIYNIYGLGKTGFKAESWMDLFHLYGRPSSGFVIACPAADQTLLGSSEVLQTSPTL